MPRACLRRQLAQAKAEAERVVALCAGRDEAFMAAFIAWMGYLTPTDWKKVGKEVIVAADKAMTIAEQRCSWMAPAKDLSLAECIRRVAAVITETNPGQRLLDKLAQAKAKNERNDVIIQRLCQSSPPADWKPQDAFSDPVGYGKHGDLDFVDDVDVSNSGDVADHAMAVGAWRVANQFREAAEAEKEKADAGPS